MRKQSGSAPTTSPTRILSAADKVALAKRRLSHLRSNEFRVYLDDGALMVSDMSGNGRDPTKYAPKLFDEIVAGLNEDPTLLDVSTDAQNQTKPDDRAALARMAE